MEKLVNEEEAECLWLARPKDKKASITLKKRLVRGAKSSRRTIVDENGFAHRYWELDNDFLKLVLSPNNPLDGIFGLFRVFLNGKRPLVAEHFLDVG